MLRIAERLPDLGNDEQDLLRNIILESIDYGRNDMAEYIVSRVNEQSTSGYNID